MNYMFMNHRNRVDSAYVRYRVTYDTDPTLKAVKPYWLDVKNCLSDPVFDVPGGGRRGSTYRRSKTFTFPEAGRLIAGGGHVHGGARSLDVRRADCRGKLVYRSRPTWGGPRHPFYNVRPILHEPGPISMSGFNSAQGFPVAKGERLRLDARYDNRYPHTRVMGIAISYLAPDPSVTKPCGPNPTDVLQTLQPHGRKSPPRFKVPIVGIRAGRARDISAPPGRRVRLRSGSTIDVGSEYFRSANVTVGQGASLRWLFNGDTLHNVTVANGPSGFSSLNLDGGREYTTKLTRPGTYRLFCALHPVTMTGTVKVLPKKRRRH
jgi:plastocyanin